MSSRQDTRWVAVFVAVIAGCVGAAQIGKVAAALSVVIADLDLTLVEGGLVVSLFTLTTALSGAVFGIFADRFGHLRLAVLGLLISAAGAFAGAFSSGAPALFATRVIEGVGFTLAVVSLPPLVSAAASVRDRPLAMGLWGAFMPGGIGLMMLVSPPVLFAFGWRGQWTGVGWALVAIALVLWLTCRQDDGPGRRDSRGLKVIGAAVLKPGPLLLFGCFACYSAMYVPLTSFFTTILITQKQVALDVAAWIGAPVVASNIVGNMSAGWLVRRGTAPHRLLAVAFVVMGIAGCMVFLAPTPVWMKAVFGLAFSAFGGLIPGTLFILAPGLAAHPAQIAALSGLLLQGAGVGQTLGPVLVSAGVEAAGSWSVGGLAMLAAAAAGLVLSRRLVPGREAG